jgi:hypothetical protein
MRGQAAEIEALEGIRVAHPMLIDCHNDLVSMIEAPAGRNIAFLFGATGVGKTMLVTTVHELIWDQYEPDDEHPGRFPILYFSAPPSTAYAPASLKWATQLALKGIREPAPDRKRTLPRPPVGQTHLGQFDSRSPLPPAFQALVDTLRDRETKAVLIDDSHQFSNGLSRGRIELQLEYFKLLADLSGALVVLIGTYALLSQRNINAQLGRRSDDIHFRRYRADIPEERRNFLGFLNSLMHQIDEHADATRVTVPCLVDHFELLYSRSAGCVGIVKRWVVVAANDALRERRREVTAGDLHRRAPTIARTRTLLQEILAAEEQLVEEEADEESLLVLAGLRGFGSGARPTQAAGASSTSPKRPRPGERWPVADPVGDLADHSA